MAASISTFMMSTAAIAHHGTANYNTDNQVTVKGTVTDFEFNNPHVLIYMQGKDDSGKIVKWEGELTSPNHLSRAGWKKDTIKPGDVISFTGHTGTSTENFGWVQELRGRYVVVRDRDALRGFCPASTRPPLHRDEDDPTGFQRHLDDGQSRSGARLFGVVSRDSEQLPQRRRFAAGLAVIVPIAADAAWKAERRRSYVAEESVAYATDDRASEEKTARARRFESRWCTA